MLGRFLDKAPGEFDYAIETRNPNYLSPPFLDFLDQQGVGYIYIDGYHIPPIGQVFDRYQPAIAKPSVIRLHGSDRRAIEKETGEIWNRIVAPKPTGLRDAARIVRANRQRNVRTFVNVNNHYEGSAPLTIRRFLDVLLDEEK